jgi:hypothetical protein
MENSSSNFPYRLHNCTKLREPDRPSRIRPRTARADFDGWLKAPGSREHSFRVPHCPRRRGAKKFVNAHDAGTRLTLSL